MISGGLPSPRSRARPVTVLTFRLNYLLTEVSPLGYHAVNGLLHAGVTLLYNHLAGRLLSRLPAALAALLFAVHPVHTEAVTGVVGRAELLASVFFLVVILQYSKMARQSSVSWRGLMLTSLLICLAMFSKEQGITVIAVCVVHEVFVAQLLSPADLLSSMSGKVGVPAWAKRILALAVIGVGLMYVRLRIMGTQLPVFTR